MNTCVRLLLILIVSVTPIAAQERPAPAPPKPEAQIEAMNRLAYLAGDWTGEGWMDMGGRRATFRGGELVQMKLGGTALLVEGSFFARIPGNGADVPVHTTLGVISFDPATNKYRFTTWLATGTSGERELTLTKDGWKWEMKHPRGAVRYRMQLTESGDWFEIGERSADGTNWQKFFEMTLRKKQ